MRSSGIENCDKPGSFPDEGRDIAMLPPISKKCSPSPDSDAGMEDFMPNIGVSGYRDLRKQASRTSSPPSRIGSMYSSTAGSPTKFPSLDGSTRYSVASLGSSRSVKLSTRGSMCRSPSCPQLYSDMDDDPFPEVSGGDLNASIHPHMVRKVGQPTILRLPEIFNAAENIPKFRHQPNGVKNTQWSKATPRANQKSALDLNSSSVDRKEGNTLKRQTTSSVGSSLGSSPTKSDTEPSQYYGNALLLPLRENKRVNKKRKHIKRGENATGKGLTARKEKGSKDNFPTIGKWDCDDYCSDGSSNSVDSDCDLTYDQDIAIDKIAMENKVKFGCMKSL